MPRRRRLSRASADHRSGRRDSIGCAIPRVRGLAQGIAPPTLSRRPDPAAHASGEIVLTSRRGRITPCHAAGICAGAARPVGVCRPHRGGVATAPEIAIGANRTRLDGDRYIVSFDLRRARIGGRVDGTVQPPALGERRSSIRHATRSSDRPVFEPSNAGELGQALEQAEGSVTGGRRGPAGEPSRRPGRFPRATGERSPAREDFARLGASERGSTLPRKWKAMRAHRSRGPAGELSRPIRPYCARDRRPFRSRQAAARSRCRTRACHRPCTRLRSYARELILQRSVPFARL